MATVLTLPSSRRLSTLPYRCFLANTGGDPIGELGVNSGSFSRALDDMSSARVQVNPTATDPSCMDVLQSLEPYANELIIYRGPFVVWVGPIIEPEYAANEITLAARDLFSWFERRLVHNDIIITADLSDIATAIINDALAPDPTPQISVTVSPTGIVGSRVIYATHHRRAADELRELSRTGLDFTVIARDFRFGGKVVETPPFTITDDFFVVGNVKILGLQKATKTYVLGATPSGLQTPVSGEAGGMGVGGLVERVWMEPGIMDPESATAAAQTRHDMLNTAPIQMTGKLTDTAPFSFTDLIPGAVVDARVFVGGRTFTDTLRLHDVNVSWRSSEQGMSEEVELVLIPLGTTEGGF